MIIAKEKKQKNIAEYILYMWQIEDLIRANNFDIERIEQTIIKKFDADLQTTAEMRAWYENLIALMQNENCKEKGHLQFVKNSLNDLNTLHYRLLGLSQAADYQQSFAKSLPLISELKAKLAGNYSNDIEICFNALYGVLLLKLQKRTISNETQQAIRAFSELIALLSAKYHES